MRVTRDGVPVVIHDATTGRVGDRDVDIADSTFDRVRAVRLENGEPIPTLADACSVLAGRAPIDVEIKPNSKVLAELVLAELRRRDLLEDAIVTSFEGPVLKHLRRIGYGGRLGLIVGSKSWRPAQRAFESWPLRQVRANGADALVIHHRLAHALLRSTLRRKGFGLYLWMSIEDECKSASERAAAYRRLPTLDATGVIVGRVAEAMPHLSIAGDPPRQT